MRDIRDPSISLVIQLVFEMLGQLVGTEWFDNRILALTPAQQVDVAAALAAERKEF